MRCSVASPRLLSSRPLLGQTSQLRPCSGPKFSLWRFPQFGFWPGYQLYHQPCFQFGSQSFSVMSPARSPILFTIMHVPSLAPSTDASPVSSYVSSSVLSRPLPSAPALCPVRFPTRIPAFCPGSPVSSRVLAMSPAQTPSPFTINVPSSVSSTDVSPASNHVTSLILSPIFS